MNVTQHTIPGGMVPVIIAFIHRVRKEGLNAGIQESIDSLAAAGTEVLENRNRFKTTLRAICCCSPEEMELFDRAFDEYWTPGKLEHKESFRKIISPIGSMSERKSSLVMMGEGRGENE